MTAISIAPVYLGALFLLAGTAKILSRSAEDLVARFDLPRWIVRMRLFRALPWLEMLLGISLVSSSDLVFVVSSFAAVGLAIIFLALVTRAWIREESFDCGCFGTWDHARVGGGLVVRNVLIVGLAVICAVLSVPAYPGVIAVVFSFGPGDISWSIATLSAIALTLVISSAGQISERASSPTQPEDAGPRLTSTVADTEIVTWTGDVSTVRMLATMQPCLVLVVKSGCRSCEMLMSRFESIASDLRGRLTVRLAVGTSPTLFEAAHPELASDSVFAVAAFREKLGVTSFPAAVVIGLDGNIQVPPVQGIEAVEEFVDGVAKRVDLRGSVDSSTT